MVCVDVLDAPAWDQAWLHTEMVTEKTVSIESRENQLDEA